MNKALATTAGLVASMTALANSVPEPQVNSKPQKQRYRWNVDSCGRKLVIKRRAKEKHRRYINKLKRRNGWK